MKEPSGFPKVIRRIVAQIYYLSGNSILIRISLLLVDILYNLAFKKQPSNRKPFMGIERTFI